MSNYAVEPRRARRPSRRRPSSRSAMNRSRACRAGPCCARRSAPPSACGCSKSAPGRSGSCGRASPAASAARSRWARSRRSSRPTRACRSTRASRPTTRMREPFVVLIDPSRQEFIPGEDKTGDGTALNVRAMYQRCPHLGCKPNPCLKNFWIECPCHGSRYDRLGTKALGARLWPGAARPRPVLGHRERRPGALRRHVEDHPRAAARRARPARASSRRSPPTGCI